MRNLFFFVRILEGVKRLFGPVMFWITVFVAFMLGLGWAASVFADYSIEVNNDGATTFTFGNDEYRYDAQSFTTEGTEPISSVEANVYKVGSPIDGMEWALQSDDGGEPDGVDIVVSGSETITPTACGTPTTFEFTDAPALDDATTYWLVLRRTGDFDEGGNIYGVCQDTADPYAGGFEAYYHSGSLWTPRSGRDVRMTIYFVEGGGGGGETATATSTVINNPNQDFFNGVLLFLVSFFGTVWLFRRRT